ncbi:MAG: hypothetical protein ING19_07190 [Azospirillum sp.]|nr:hypothetical protein [Azospirillum sp.]
MNTSNSRFTLDGLSIGEAELAAHRHALYHSTGPGYILIRDFLNSDAVAHLRALWSTVDASHAHQAFVDKTWIYRNCPNYVNDDGQGNRSFYNFFWNAPLDEVTFTACLHIQMLRNRIAGRAPFTEVFATGAKAASYRVVHSRNATTWIAPHRDYFDEKNKFDKMRYDLTRLQATLFLAEKGVDYSGTGFKFECNDGTHIVFGDEFRVRAGDLAIWRYNNLHSVENVESEPGQFGFLRIIHPFETLNDAAPAAKPASGRSFVLRVVSGARRRLGV